MRQIEFIDGFTSPNRPSNEGLMVELINDETQDLDGLKIEGEVTALHVQYSIERTGESFGLFETGSFIAGRYDAGFEIACHNFQAEETLRPGVAFEIDGTGQVQAVVDNLPDTTCILKMRVNKL